MTGQARREPGRWAARPGWSRALRAVGVLAPFGLSIAAAWALGRVVPQAGSVGTAVARWFGIAVASTAVLLVVERLARRLLPLRTLLGLTLAFPDRAPSRVRLALRTTSTAQLRAVVERARAGELDGPPEQAAERVLQLVMALSLHDRLTRGHAERVRALTEVLARELGLPEDEVDRLRWAGLLHDIGKLLVPADVLNKPGRLTDAEFEVIKRHPEQGRAFVEPLAPWLGEAARAVWEHHEKWDGSGYPRGLAGEDISFAARVVAVADCYDVMTSQRSYKEPVTPAEARAELARCAGSHFDPAVVRAFLRLSLGGHAGTGRSGTVAAHLSLLPQALAPAATTGGVVATAALGLASAGLGLGLAGAAAAEPVPVDRLDVVGDAPPGPQDVTVPDLATTTDASGESTVPPPTEAPAPSTTSAPAPTTTVVAPVDAIVDAPDVPDEATATTRPESPGGATATTAVTTSVAPETEATPAPATTAPTTTTTAPSVPDTTTPSATTTTAAPILVVPSIPTPIVTVPQVTLTVPRITLVGG